MQDSRPSLLRSISLWSLGVATRSILAFLYIILLARLLPLEGFAAWGVVISIGNALVILSRVFGFWAPRLREHERPVGVAWTTGLLGSVILAMLTGLVLALAAEPLSLLININYNYFVYSVPVIVMFIVYGYAQFFFQATRPEKEPLGIIIFELSRLLSFIIILAVTASQVLFYIAVLSHAIGMIAYILYVSAMVGIAELYPKLLIDWMKKWRPPFMEGIAVTLSSLLRPVVSAIAGPEPVAYLNVGLSFSRITSQVLIGVSWNVYSRLLGEPGSVRVERAASGLLLLAGLTVAGVAGLAGYLASLFGPEYGAAGLVLVVLTFRSAVNSIGVLYARVAQAQAGIEFINRVALILLIAQSLSLALGGLAAGLGGDPLEKAVYASLGVTAPSLFYTALMVRIAEGLGFSRPARRETLVAVVGLAAGGVAYLPWEPLAPVAYSLTVMALSPFARSLVARLARGGLRVLGLG